MISTPDDDESGIVEKFIIPAPTITNSAPAIIYVSFSRSDSAKFDIATFTNMLKFTSKEVDPDTGEPEQNGYDDEYEVDVLSLTAGDYLLPTYIGNFQSVWDSLGIHNEVSDTFALTSMKSIQGPSKSELVLIVEATSTLTDLLSLQPLEGTELVMSSSMHSMKLSGQTIAGGKVVALAKMAFSQKSGVTLKLSARSPEIGDAQLVLDAVGA
jgi:coatomer protein complex subunit gamma